MKRFHFPLRPVAVIRAHKKLRAREVFAAAVHAYVQSEEKLVGTRARVAQFEAALFAGRRERFLPAEEAQSLAAYRRECAEETAMEHAVIVARAEMETRREAYVEAHREVEVVNRLELKARAAHRLDVNRAEQAEFDDFAGRTHSIRHKAPAE